MNLDKHYFNKNILTLLQFAVGNYKKQ